MSSFPPALSYDESMRLQADMWEVLTSEERSGMCDVFYTTNGSWAEMNYNARSVGWDTNAFDEFMTATCQ